VSDRQHFIDLIDRWKMPKSHLATQANVNNARVTDYLQGRPVLPAKRRAIERVIKEAAEIYSAFYPLRVDISDRENFALATEYIRTYYGAKRSAEDSDAMLNQANTVFELSLSGK